jgi:2-haloacid dehalogenase
LEHWDGLKPWPEAKGMRRTLRERGYMLGVVTNCSEELGRRAAARLGAEARGSGEAGFTFDAVVTAEEAGFYKSYSRPCQDVLQKLGVKWKGRFLWQKIVLMCLGR